MSNDRRKPIAASPALVAAVVVISAVCAVLGYSFGDGYIARLPNHDGYFLVAVANRVDSPPRQRPERTVVVVIDGLREDSARQMTATERIGAGGLCRTTDVGDLTISRPIYAVLSTGLEADRTGSRNNDETRPITPVSIWQVARESGLDVTAYSQLPWWRQLFPEAFTRYVMDEDHATDLLALAQLGDLTLVHPTYVDEMGHQHGAASTEYRDAVARADIEINRLLDRLDLGRDAVILTADHGHVDAGGHGAEQPEVARVLTCVAGRGLAASSQGHSDPLDLRSLAPALAVLLGTPFPPHMRASAPGEDSLDQIWTLLDSSVLGAGYIAARHADIEAIRLANGEQLSRWLGGDDGGWTALYDRERRAQLKRAGAAVLVIVLVVIASLRARRLPLRRSLGAVAWMISAFAVPALIYTAWRGGFDFSSVNSRAIFVRTSIASCAAGGIAVLAAHVLLFRDARQLILDLATTTAVVVALGVAHRLAYGVPLGFPLPPRLELFFPFFAAAFAASIGSIGVGVTITAFIVDRHRRPAA